MLLLVLECGIPLQLIQHLAEIRWAQKLLVTELLLPVPALDVTDGMRHPEQTAVRLQPMLVGLKLQDQFSLEIK